MGNLSEIKTIKNYIKCHLIDIFFLVKDLFFTLS